MNDVEGCKAELLKGDFTCLRVLSLGRRASAQLRISNPSRNCGTNWEQFRRDTFHAESRKR